MKGRSPYNRPSVRMKELYELLHRLNGESRWKNLKANLKELGWGPTTLKNTLDQMIQSKIIIREARLGDKGAEVWYKLKTKNDYYIPTLAGKPTIELTGYSDSIDSWIDSTRERAQQLEGKEKGNFLREVLRRMLWEVTMYSPLCHFLFALKNVKIDNYSEQETLLNFDLEFDQYIKKTDKSMMKLLLEYPDYAIEILDQFMRESYKQPSVPRRTFKTLIELMSSPHWVRKSYAINQTNSRSEKNDK